MLWAASLRSSSTRAMASISTDPDVILAAYSGISQSDYDILSQIAPVVAYPTTPWSTAWREMIRLNSAALGMASEGDALIARIEAEIAKAVAAHPDLAGQTALFVTHVDPLDLSRISFYTDNDTRVQFFKDLGLTSPRAVVETSKSGVFSGSVSAERVDMFEDVDIVVTYGDEATIERLSANALLSTLPAIRNLAGRGHEVIVLSPSSIDLERLISRIPRMSYEVLKLERQNRLTAISGYGAKVIDWMPDVELSQALLQVRTV